MRQRSTTRLGTADVVGLNQLSPRRRQTLERLLSGLSEKEIAAEFGISRHTVHGYVKEIYLQYAVNSRSELMALWIKSLRPGAGYGRGDGVGAKEAAG